SGEQERDFVAIADVVRANVAALEHAGGEIVNLGSGRGTSVNAICHALARIIGYRQQPLYGPAKAGEVSRIYLSGEKAYRLLGWQPAVSLDAGLAATVASLEPAQSGAAAN